MNILNFNAYTLSFKTNYKRIIQFVSHMDKVYDGKNIFNRITDTTYCNYLFYTINSYTVVPVYNHYENKITIELEEYKKEHRSFYVIIAFKIKIIIEEI